MKLWNKRYESHPLFIGLSAFLLTLIGLHFIFENTVVQILQPVIGVAFVLTLTYGRKVYFPLFWGVSFAQFFMRTFIWQEDIFLVLTLAMVLPLVYMIQIEVGLYMAQKLKLSKLMTAFHAKDAIKTIAQTTVLALVGSVMTFGLYYLLGLIDARLLEYAGIEFMGHWFSIALFVPIGFLGYKYDSEWLEFKGWLSLFKVLALFLGFFVLAALLVFEVGYLRFQYDAYIFLVLFIFLGFVSQYRTMHYYVLIILMFGVLYANGLDSDARYQVLFNMNLFALFGVGLALIIKRFSDEKKLQSQQIEASNIAVDRLLDDVYELLQFSSKMITEMQADEREVYLVRTLKIAMRLFDDCDGGYCYVEELGTLRFLHAIDYDLEALPYVYESHDLFTNTNEPINILQNIKEAFRAHYGEAFDILSSKGKRVKSRAMIRFELNKDLIFYIVIDKSEQRDPFTDIQIDRLEQFVQLLRSLFVRNYLTVQNMALKKEIVLSIIRTLEINDPYTKGHSEDVAGLVTAIAEKLNFDDDAMQELYWAGILHDIGKVGISNRVLNKPSTLTTDEYEAIKEHANYGYQVLFRQKDLKKIALMVKHHHEWYDGRGYPDGLSGDEIPLGSQIISIADMIATMASDRTYRKRQPKSVIIKELEKFSGTQFSPKVAEVALDLLENNLLETHFKGHY